MHEFEERLPCVGVMETVALYRMVHLDVFVRRIRNIGWTSFEGATMSFVRPSW